MSRNWQDNGSNPPFDAGAPSIENEMIHSTVRESAQLMENAWKALCERYLPIDSDDAIWRFSRALGPDDPEQGWKLHISATLLTANDVLQTVAPFLEASNVPFKAPASL